MFTLHVLDQKYSKNSNIIWTIITIKLTVFYFNPYIIHVLFF